MSDIADNVIALQGAVNSLTTEIASLTAAVGALQAPAAPTVDLSPVLAAIADIKAQLVPTPAPAAPATTTGS